MSCASIDIKKKVCKLMFANFFAFFIDFILIFCYNIFVVIFYGRWWFCLSYVALYRKYRPNNFNDLIGQNAVTSIIKNEILNNKVSHAYLFSGPRGTGKTSAAKIIAKMVNCHNLSPDGCSLWNMFELFEFL